ncbi:lipid A export ATP-binding/permease protein MsbA [Lachnospiraceae bacterium]|nr:ABC transporter ATP-binding protein [Acetatifactor sp.]GFH94255.1 lipid A export ATP-binding/permease protein MsbA [Lachnospiraceae bacterium]
MEMETDLTSKLPLREHIKNIRKVLRIVRDLDKTFFLHTGLKALLDAVGLYAGLLLSVYILDRLAAGEEFRSSFSVAALTCLLLFGLRLGNGILHNRLDVRWEIVYRRWDSLTEEKILQMDYAKIDDPKTRKMRERIWQDNNWGAGINTIRWYMEGVMSGLFRLAGALVVGAPVFLHMIRGGSMVILLTLLVMAVAMAAGSALGTLYEKRLQQFMMGKPETEEERIQNAALTWGVIFGYDYNYRKGKDFRLYHGYNLLRYWTLEKEFRRRPKVREASFNSGKSNFWGSFPAGIMECGSYLIVALLALGGTLTVGSVIRFAGCLRNIFSELSELAFKLPQLALGARRQASTLEFLDIADEMHRGKLPLEKRNDNLYRIQFRDVSFKYPNAEQYALRHFSMELKVGEKLAIVGMNGSGKTTMIKLLCRLYDPQEGEILLNGVDIRKFRHEEYSRLFSVVFQDYQLFSFPLGENVAVSEDYDETKVKKCLEGAGMGARLAEMEQGIHTYLYKDYEEGVELSGGEAQKVAIARSIYKTAPFVLLDEPTAALDPLAEYEIYKRFDEIVEDKTAIYISHRLSSCRFCDKIAVFHEGRLIQQGTHEELVEDRAGKYYEMWNAQAQYYVEA